MKNYVESIKINKKINASKLKQDKYIYIIIFNDIYKNVAQFIEFVNLFPSFWDLSNYMPESMVYCHLWSCFSDSSVSSSISSNECSINMKPIKTRQTKRQIWETKRDRSFRGTWHYICCPFLHIYTCTMVLHETTHQMLGLDRTEARYMSNWADNV